LKPDTVKTIGNAAFKAAVEKACDGGAKEVCGELATSDKTFYIVQGSQFCGDEQQAQSASGLKGCDSLGGISYEGTGGSPMLKVPSDLASWIGAEKITGGVALINTQRPLIPQYKSWSDLIHHEMVHLVGVVRTGSLFVGHSCTNPAWSGVPNSGCP